MQRVESRGREAVISTGRGGIGNLVRSPSRPADEGIRAGSERGRAISPANPSSRERPSHSGRGGAGNVRSPSTAGGRIAEERESALEEQVVEQHRGRDKAEQVPFSTGRGGAGNINGSRSRSRSRLGLKLESRSSFSSASPTGAGAGVVGGSRTASTSGRGGWGNSVHHEMTSEEKKKAELEDAKEKEILARHKHTVTVVHSSGRGGAANIVPGDAPSDIDFSNLTLEEKEAYRKVHAKDGPESAAAGRGGYGNIHAASSHHHNTQVEQVQAEEGVGRGRGRNDEKDKDGIVGKVWRSLSRAGGKDKDRKGSV